MVKKISGEYLKTPKNTVSDDANTHFWVVFFTVFTIKGGTSAAVIEVFNIISTTLTGVDSEC